MEQETWDRLFDELYLRTYAPLQPEEFAVDQALGAVALVGARPGADVLDAACGFGRHSLVLAREGYRVIGIDRSAALLAEARRRADGAEWPRFVQGDVRELPFEEESFDLVLNLFSSVVGYYGEEDDGRFFSECRRVLRPGGKLVVETMHRDRLMAIFQPRDWRRVPDGIVLEERSFDPATGVNEIYHELRPAGGEPIALTLRLRVYTAGELVALLDGFADLELYGDLAGTPLSSETRLVAVATR